MLIELPGIALRDRAGLIVAWAIVDEDDFHFLNRWAWHMNQGYARRGGSAGESHMHRLLLGLEPNDGLVVDHINRNRVDNRRANLRVIPREANIQNTGPRSGRFRGVTFEKASGKWRANVSRGSGATRKQIHLGRFNTEEEAAAVASAWRAKHLPYAVEVTA